MFKFLLKSRQQRLSNRSLRLPHINNKTISPGATTYLRATDMDRLEWYIPYCRKSHCGSVRLLVLDETDSDNVSVIIFQKKADTLETTSISGPATSARNTTRELFVFVSI